MIGGLTIVAVIVVSGVMVYAHSNRNFLPNTDQIQKTWANVNINQNSVHVLESLKSDIIHEVNPSLVNTTDTNLNQKNTKKFKGSLTLQMTVKKGLSVTDRVAIGKQILELLFSNRSVNKVGITIYQTGDERQFVQMATDKEHFTSKNKKGGISSGLQQLTIIN